MKYLLFFASHNGEAAKAYAAPVRHRRHHVYLRDIGAWQRSREYEACDGIILMQADGEAAPGVDELLKAYKGVEHRFVAPGDPIWAPDEDEVARMNPLNKLRHDAALLGIEVDPAYDEARLAGLIKAAKGDADEIAAAEEAEAQKIAKAAEKAAKAREGAGAGDGEAPPPVETPPPAADAPAPGAAVAAEAPAADAAAATAVADPRIAELANVPADDADALRAFAKANDIPTNPNPRTSAAKVLAAIKIALGVE